MSSNSEISFLDRAGRVAGTSTERQKHGCVIVKGGRVISVGVNTFLNHPNVVSNPDRESSFHAEINAIRGLDVSGSTVYVARVNNRGETKLSKPCLECYKSLKEAGVKKIIWTEDNGRIGSIT